jgi:hypothetical protein
MLFGDAIKFDAFVAKLYPIGISIIILYWVFKIRNKTMGKKFDMF